MLEALSAINGNNTHNHIFEIVRLAREAICKPKVSVPKVIFLGPVMDDVRVLLKHSDVPNLNTIIQRHNYEKLTESLNNGTQFEDIPTITPEGKTDKAQNDKIWYPPFIEFVEKYKNQGLRCFFEPGGTCYNTIEALRSVAKKGGKNLKILHLPIGRVHAVGTVFVHPGEDHKGLKAAYRPEGDFFYESLNPKFGLGKQLANTKAFVYIKNATNKNEKGTKNLLDFVDEHNKKALKIALFNGSDDPEHPELLARANVWIGTKEEFSRDEYAKYKKDFIKNPDHILIVMHGDECENGIDICTKNFIQHYAPRPVEKAKNSAGVRDLVAGIAIAGLTDVLDNEFYKGYRYDVMGLAMSIGVQCAKKNCKTTFPRGCGGTLLEEFQKAFVVEKGDAEAARAYGEKFYAPAATPC